MTNDELKDILRDTVMDEDELDKIIVLEGDEFADGFIGLTTDNHCVYGYERMIESLCKHNNWDETEATEWVEYNTMRAIPYMSSVGYEPIIIYECAREYKP